MLNNIPQELRQLPQWVVWKYELEAGKTKPTKVPYSATTGGKAESDNPATWAPFEQAVWVASAGQFNGIGFMLSPNDPYTFIDLDTYDPSLSIEDKQRHNQIAQAFAGYAELSPSGQGLHLIVKGSVPQGRRRAGVEIYSSGRYFAFTGNVWRNGPIIEQQELVTQLWSEMAPPNAAANNHQFLDKSQVVDDAVIIDRAANASNGELFKSLFTGHWQAQYPSQSEADFALIDILAFYTQNHEQIIRIFRSSALGQRPKAQRHDYMQFMLSKCFDNQPPPVNLDALKAGIEAHLARAADNGLPYSGPPLADPVYTPPPDDTGAYALPEGLLGDVAQYIYNTAQRPVPEIALCGAIGLLAGITGRAYNINGTGLSQYLLLIAPTGTGKEAIASGTSKLMEAVRQLVPASTAFIGPGAIQSGAALLKYLAKESASFLTIVGEFGKTLGMMSAPNSPPHLKDLLKTLLDVFGKSGYGNILRPTVYSNKENSTLAVSSPALTLLGESAPASFYENISESMIVDGLLPRFTLIEYLGKRVPENPFANCAPPPQLVQNVGQLCAHALMANQAGGFIDVKISPEAKSRLDAFNARCDAHCNEDGATETQRGIWARAHLRALKLAGLVAVGCNPFDPVVSVTNAEWAIRISERNTKALMLRFERGDIGAAHSEDKLVQNVVRVVRDYLTKSWEECRTYTDQQAMHQHKVIPYGYINKRLVSAAAFRTHKAGATAALQIAIKTMIDSGLLIELSKQECFNRFGVTARGFAIGSIKAFT